MNTLYIINSKDNHAIYTSEKTALANYERLKSLGLDITFHTVQY